MKKQLKIFYLLLLLVLILSSLNLAKAYGWLIPKEPQITIEDKTVHLEDLTLKQKIAQMVIVHGSLQNLQAWQKLQLGGIHLFALADENLFKKTIQDFQKDRSIPFLVTSDLEGCWNPFANFYNFTAAREVGSTTQAFEKGRQEGRFLSQLGFSLNFAPVVDLDDQIWRCRSFPGSPENITDLANAYILGLQSQGISATAKHYPGKTLVVRDPHKYLVLAEVSEKDIYPYLQLVKTNGVRAIMVSHLIVSGEVNSFGQPSDGSGEVINQLKTQFKGLIISDEINMLGLKNFYNSSDEMYLAVFKAGNDLVLNFNEDPNEINHMIDLVAKAVEKGEISETRIDNSVKKILELKGFKVI